MSKSQNLKSNFKYQSLFLAFALLISILVFPAQNAYANDTDENLVSLEKIYELSSDENNKDSLELFASQEDLDDIKATQDTSTRSLSFKLDARSLMTGTYPQAIKVKAYTLTEQENNQEEKIISVINSSFFRKKQARKYKFVIEVPESFSSQDLYIDVYDADLNLKASFKQYLETNSTESAPSIESADCDNTVFGACQLQYILNSINYQASVSKRANVIVNQEKSGKYTVTLPLIKANALKIVNKTIGQGPISDDENPDLNIDTSSFITQADLDALLVSGELVGPEGPQGQAGTPGASGSFSGSNPVFSNTATMDGVFKLTAQDDPPGSPEAGDIYHDSSDAICAYSSLTSSWNKLSGVGSCQVGTDQAPAAFDFTDITSTPSTLVTSNTETITSFDNAPISISGQGTPMYSIDSGAFTASTGTVYTGQTVQLRLTSNATLAETHRATLTIGSVSDDWIVSTLSCPDNFAFIPGSAGLDSFGNANGDFAAGWCVSQYEMSPQGTGLWTRDGANGWHYSNSSGSGKSITAKGGGDSFPITQVTRNEAAAACADDLTTPDGTSLTNGKLLTAYWWSNINQAIVDDGINWSGGTPGSGNLSRGNSSSGAPLPGIAEGTDATQPTAATFYYTAEQGRSCRMGTGEDSVYDWAGNVWEWFDDLHNNAGGAAWDDIDGSTLAYEHDNPNGSVNITMMPSEKSTHDNTTNGVGRIYVNNSVLISGTTYAARFGGSWTSTANSGVFSSIWDGYSPSGYRNVNVGFRCIIPSQ